MATEVKPDPERLQEFLFSLRIFFNRHPGYSKVAWDGADLLLWTHLLSDPPVTTDTIPWNFTISSDLRLLREFARAYKLDKAQWTDSI